MTANDDTIPAVVLILAVFYVLAQAVSIGARILRDRVARDVGRCVHREPTEECRCESWRSSRP